MISVNSIFMKLENIPERNKNMRVELRLPLMTDFWNDIDGILCPWEDIVEQWVGSTSNS